jgi:hypothetical protein
MATISVRDFIQPWVFPEPERFQDTAVESGVSPLVSISTTTLMN